jgi:hypothetical protein
MPLPLSALLLLLRPSAREPPLQASLSLAAPTQTHLRLCPDLLLLPLPLWVAAGMLLPASGKAQRDTVLEPRL